MPGLELVTMAVIAAPIGCSVAFWLVWLVTKSSLLLVQ